MIFDPRKDIKQMKRTEKYYIKERFKEDRKKFLTTDSNYIKLFEKDQLKHFTLANEIISRFTNQAYERYTFFLAQFLDKENKLVATEVNSLPVLQKEDIVARLQERFDISEKTVVNYLSAAKKANILIKIKGDNIVKSIYIMNPVLFNGGHNLIHSKLMFYFPDDLCKLIAPYQYLACAKIVNVDYPKVNECHYLFNIDRSRYNIDKVMNGEMFEIPNALKKRKSMGHTEAMKFFARRGISDVLGIPLAERFNCIFHNDNKEMGLVIFKDSKEKYFCLEDQCVSGDKRLGLDIYDLLYVLLDIQEEPNKLRLAMQYLANLYNVELEKTVAEEYQTVA